MYPRVLERRADFVNPCEYIFVIPLVAVSISPAISVSEREDTHSHDLPQQIYTKSLCVTEEEKHIPAPDLFHLSITAPGPDREFELMLANIDVPGLLHSFLGEGRHDK